jgi:hypothetical protein
LAAPAHICVGRPHRHVGTDIIRPVHGILRCAQDDKGVCGCVQTHLVKAAGGGVPDASRIPWLPLEGKLPRSGCGM